MLVKAFTKAKLHNAKHYSTNVLYEKNGNTSVFDVISDITSRKRIISTDIMSQPFYDLTVIQGMQYTT